ncbi:hypothetical protein K6Q96_21800 [Grimontia kaedaensis]|uniref:Cysteine dioxygenase n=1 Tax=Grimontia kaedaensis TaxID=2872157 RepID=A0ABY4WZD9_9GAMM|nr:hypothetical protein [Grimontia kaedaensis]USH04374.1 hypothetical protein K6Q96_21800 [Grimontia kaedaensis]
MKKYFGRISSVVSACNRGKINAKQLCEFAVNEGISFTWHPLGFMMATLLDEGREKIRLHLWTNTFDKAQKPTWLIHDHKFDLTSWVLSGSIKNIEYKDLALPETHQLYSVSYSSTGSVLTKLDKVYSLAVDKTQEVNEGEAYRISAGTFHQSLSLSSKTTVTICHTTDKKNTPPLVIGDIDGMEQYYYQRSPVLADELQLVIEQI